jgi:hypothetical protein
VDQSLDEIKTQLSQFEPGTPDHEEWRLKALIKLEEIRQHEGAEGLKEVLVAKPQSATATVDASSKAIAWRALTCWNPDCLGKGKGGGPVLFVQPLKHVQVGTDGKLHWRTLEEKELTATPPAICPVCNQSRQVRTYDLLQVELKRKKLTDELEAVRHLRAKAAADKKLVPAGSRTPSEIMRDLAGLPKLFFIPEAQQEQGEK